MNNNFRITHYQIANEFNKKHQFIYLDGAKVFFLLRNGYYQPVSGDVMNKLITEFLVENGMDNFATVHHLKNICVCLNTLTLIKEEPKRSHLLNCKNGVLNLHTMTLEEMDPSKHIFFFRVEHDFNPETTEMPMFQQYLEDTFAPFSAEERQKLIAVLQEFMGLCFLPSSKYHKQLVLLGGASTGKSVFLEILEQLVGKSNTSHVSISDFNRSNSEYYLAKLHGTLLNISGENEARQFIKDEATMKAIVSGDPIMARLAYGQAFDFRPYCKLVMATNNMPGINDKTNAVYRRLIILPFKHVVKNPVFDLAKQIVQKEGEAIFNWALQGLERLEKQGHFTKSEVIQAEIDNAKQGNNTISQWISEECQMSGLYYGKDAYKDFCRWCAENGFQSMNKHNFIDTLEKAHGIEYKKRRQYHGNYMFIGLSKSQNGRVEQIEERLNA